MPVKTYTYKTFGQNQGILADVHYDRTGNGQGRRFAIALGMHAGGFVVGGRDMITSTWSKVLIDRGFIVVAIDYRLCPQVSIYDGPIQDTRDAYYWCRTQLPKLLKDDLDIEVDGDRIVAFGNSAGGHLAMMLGLEDEKPCAIFNGYGPIFLQDPCYTKPVKRIVSILPEGPLNFDDDFVKKVYDEPILTSFNSVKINAQGVPEIDFSQPRNAWHFGNISHGTWLEAMNIPGQEEKIDPALHLDSTFPPTIFVHGDEDQVVNVKVSIEAYEKLKAFGVETEMVVAKGMPHAFHGGLNERSEGYEEYLVKPADFLKKYV